MPNQGVAVDNPSLLGILRLWQFLPKAFASLLVKQSNYIYEHSNHEHFASGFPQGIREERMDEEHYSNASDYVRSLIREDQKQQDEKKLEQMLLEGVRSGKGMEINSKEDWKKFWETIDARIKTKQQEA
jgi:antitoxin ParD1/3/4